MPQDTPRFHRMLASLPFYYEAEPIMRELIDGAAVELNRIEARAEEIRDGLVPGMATDKWGLLGFWEAIMGLPVEPPERSEFQRRETVKARLRMLNSGAGSEWVESMSLSIGTNWQHTEDTPGDFQLLIEIPFEPGAWNTGWVGRVARDFTPAHLSITVSYAGHGFIVDLSPLDEDLL